MSFEVSRGDYRISTDKKMLDLHSIHSFLTTSYWAEGIPKTVVAASIENSLCFGLYHGDRQIGFARVISDYATFAYLADVYIIESYRKRGLARWLMEAIIGHPNLQGLRRWMLATQDAHGLYQKVGFTLLGNPERFMEINKTGIYKTVAREVD